MKSLSDETNPISMGSKSIQQWIRKKIPQNMKTLDIAS